MKRIIEVLFILCLLFVFTGCEKDENCNCGVITDDEILGDCYSLTVRNDCTDNYETFCFDYDVWYGNYVGDDFCVTNVDEW